MQTYDGADATRVLQSVEALAPQIRDTGDAIEAERCLPPTVVRAMKEAGVFRLAIPRAYGGLELDPLILLPALACTIIDTWHTSGLRGTGSHDYQVDNVFVPFEETLNFFDPPRYAGPLYALPQMFLVNHAGVPLGIARSALDAVVELSAHKEMMPARRLLREEGQVQEAVAWAEAALGAVRSYT